MTREDFLSMLNAPAPPKPKPSPNLDEVWASEHLEIVPMLSPVQCDNCGVGASIHDVERAHYDASKRQISARYCGTYRCKSCEKNPTVCVADGCRCYCHTVAPVETKRRARELVDLKRV